MKGIRLVTTIKFKNSNSRIGLCTFCSIYKSKGQRLEYVAKRNIQREINIVSIFFPSCLDGDMLNPIGIYMFLLYPSNLTKTFGFKTLDSTPNILYISSYIPKDSLTQELKILNNFLDGGSTYGE